MSPIPYSLLLLTAILPTLACSAAQEALPSTRSGHWEVVSSTAENLHQRLSEVKTPELEGPLRDELEALLVTVEQFNLRWPMDLDGLSLEAQIAMSLDESIKMDHAFARLLEVAPERTQSGLAWATYWVNRKPERAVSILDALINERPDALLYQGARVKALLLIDPEGLDRRFEALIDEQKWDQAAIMLEATARNDAPRAIRLSQPCTERAQTDVRLAVAITRAYRMDNRFAEARRILDAFPDGTITDPGHLYLWSDTCYADHDFQRAFELLQAVDMDSIETTRPGLHRRLRTMIPLREVALKRWPVEQGLRIEDAKEGTNPLATLTIEGREVVVELFADDAPNTVGSFIAATDLGIYNGHEAGQVHTGFRTIFGDRIEGDPIPTWSVADEHEHPNHRDIFAGTLVAYKESKPHSADTRFYILHFPAPHLNGARTAFGRVISGLDVVREMRQGDVLDRVEITRRPDSTCETMVLDQDGQVLPLQMLLSE